MNSADVYCPKAMSKSPILQQTFGKPRALALRKLWLNQKKEPKRCFMLFIYLFFGTCHMRNSFFAGVCPRTLKWDTGKWLQINM